jgi:hypothetical protein
MLIDIQVRVKVKDFDILIFHLNKGMLDGTSCRVLWVLLLNLLHPQMEAVLLKS